MRQDYKIGIVCGGVPVGWRRMNGGDESVGIWLMGFIYMYEIE
jgi:hypothetical protein